jgi:hypothetical protein
VTPVLVEVVRGTVKIMHLVETDDGLALHPEGRFEFFGQVTQVIEHVVVKKDRPPVPRTMWQWTHTPGQSSLALTKAKAIAAMLADRGYQPFPSTAVIPPLF